MSPLMILTCLVALLVALVGFVAVKIVWAFRALDTHRIAVYMDHMGVLHETMEALRRNKKPPSIDVSKEGKLQVIASFPTMKASGDVLKAFSNIAQKRRAGADAAEIEAAIQSAEKELVVLNVAMREDLRLNTGSGRFPNAEVFRRRRGASK